MAFLKISAVTVVAVVALVTAMGVADAQSTPSCAQKLVPCANFINSTKPPASCCDPLREAVTLERDCLCNLYNTPGLLPSLGINVTQALLLPSHCNIPGNISDCTKATSPPTSPSASDTSSVPPPAPRSNGDKLASVGLSSLLLIWASMMIS